MQNNYKNNGNWSYSVLVAIILGILQAFWGVAYTSIVANQNRIEEQDLVRYRQIEREFLRIREHEEFTRRLDANLTRDRSNIDELIKEMGQLYTVKDAIIRLQTRVDQV